MLELEIATMHLKRSAFFARRKRRIVANTSRGYKKSFNRRDSKRSQKYFEKADCIATSMLKAGRTEEYDQYLNLILGD